MSERRQLALLLAGLVALVAVGIGGATLFPERCSGLEQLGDLELAFTDADDALPLSEDDGETVHRVGEELGIGPWRGAVALPEGARILPSEFGFFVVTDDDFTVLRPSIGIASAARGRAGLDVIPAGSSLALRAEDGETGIFNGEYELDRCGQLPPDAEVLAIDRGFAAVAGEDAGTRLVTLSGDEVWSSELGATAAHITAGGVLLATPEGQLRLVEIRSGAVLDEVEAGNRLAGWWWADDQVVVVQDGFGPKAFDVGGGLVPREDATTELSVPWSLHGVVRTDRGLLVFGTAQADDGQDTALALADGPMVALPAGVAPVGLERSADGHVGVLVEVEGERALLVYAPDAG